MSSLTLPLITTESAVYNETFKDIYFNAKNGLAETEHVFLKGNDLTHRFEASKNSFHIGETGFGTGLNFLATWKLWKEHAPAHKRLIYCSCEAFPIEKKAFEKCLQFLCGRWPHLQPEAHLLNQTYQTLPLQQPGFYSLPFEKHRVELLLLLGEASTTWKQFTGRIDAWFLDGFSPKTNPDLWTEDLFQILAEHSHPETTLSTFSAAGWVRRNLEKAGFTVHKRPGFDNKREMTVGRWTRSPVKTTSKENPWFQWPTPSSQRQITIVGAGLAGCASAFAFSKRNWNVELLERHSSHAEQASSNRAAIFYPLLTTHEDPISTASLQAFHLLTSELSFLTENHPDLSKGRCGVLQLLYNSKIETRLFQARQRLGLDPEFAATMTASEAVDFANLPKNTLPSPALLFKNGGWLPPRQLCEAYLKSFPERIHCRFDHSVPLDFKPAPNHLLLYTAGEQSADFDFTRWLFLKKLTGKVFFLDPIPELKSLRTVLSFNGFLTPLLQETHLLGSSYPSHQRQAELTNEKALLTKLLSRIHLGSFPSIQGHWMQTRTTTPDTLPLVGPLPQLKAYVRDYRDLYKANPRLSFPSSELVENVFLNSAHGSRGLLSTYLGAEILAAHLSGEPLPVPREFLELLHPARFLIRTLKKLQPAQQDLLFNENRNCQLQALNRLNH